MIDGLNFESCEDEADYVDSDGNNCEWYSSFPSDCGLYDFEGSSAFYSCCACLSVLRSSNSLSQRIFVARVTPIQDDIGVVMCSYQPY